MKLVYKKHFYPLALICSCFVVGLTLQSCSKEKNDKDLDAGEQVNLRISVLGITDIGDADPGVRLKASSAVRAPLKQPTHIPGKLLNFASFDALVSVEKGALETSDVSLRSESNKGAAGNDLVAEAVDVGVKYRLLIYTQEGDFVRSDLLTSGSVEEIKVPKGNDYYWYAVSYNNTEDIPDVDSSNPVLALPGNEDVLYASGELIIDVAATDANIPLGIVFKHSLARVAIELNTMGMFADIVSADIRVSGNSAETGVMDLRTGELSGLANESLSLDFSDFSDIDPLYADRKRAYFYTVEDAESTNLTVTLNGLELALDDGSTRSFSNLAENPSVFTFNIDPQQGTSYNIKLDLVESPLTLDGVQWARQNLYYLEGHNGYRFHHTYAHTNARNSYFSFKGEFPTEYGINSDPCTKVYPEGLWRQASHDDFYTLTGDNAGVGAQPATFGEVTVGGQSLGYVEYEGATGTGSPYPNNNLHFNMNGIITGALVGYGGQVRVWTSSSAMDLVPGVPGLAAYVYYANAANSVLMGSSLLNVTEIGTDEIKTYFFNVRCVRN